MSAFRCNKCWKRLGEETGSQCYITTCSHMFCLECGEKSFSRQPICPGCGKTLTRSSDVQQIDLHPSEEVRMMSLCGLDPETMTVMEMAARGMSFYAYQKQNEIAYLSFINRKATQKIQQISKGFDTQLIEAHNTISVLNGQIRNLKEEISTGKQDYSEIQQKLKEKIDQKRRVEEMFETLKQKYEALTRSRRGGFSPSSAPSNFTPPSPTPLQQQYTSKANVSRSPAVTLGGVSGQAVSRSSLHTPHSTPRTPFQSFESPRVRHTERRSSSGQSWSRERSNSFGSTRNPLHPPETPTFSSFIKSKESLQ
ncbi:putative E3 ubiquitin-protein ligase CCNB1IP1 [Blattamonas nauphoetae]|uniref:E3 ubiquitin-protein ligase CCNB1IP1 n=1 Tax=Blattamonas nauphoetae TaxID=2049346 RepID=A0ABQ9YI17_9EUKA|nr:putative E3 ubiquitin-protein ligase CCNB1IP1 [Blattamonas nauphoetae]